MFKNVLFANPELKSFLNDQQYDTLIIEEIRWRTDYMGRCEPVIVARAAGSLSEAAAYAALVHQQYLNVSFKNRNADKGEVRIGTRIQRI